MTQAQKMIGTGLSPASARAIAGFAADALTASGTTQADAYALGQAVNQFTTAAAGTGAVLPGSVHGDTIFVSNQGANDLKVYPPVGGKINNGAANAAFTVTAGKCAVFRALTGINFVGMLSA